MVEKLTDEEKINEYVNKRILKQVLKQKVLEFTLVPVGLVAIGFITYWTGKVTMQLLKIEEVTPIFDQIINGVSVLFLISAIVWANIFWARNILEKKARKELGIKENYYDGL